jgi:hypothetical protein
MLRLDASKVAWQGLGDDMVALNLASSEYYSVNATAAALWTLLAEGTSEDALASCLEGRYELPRADAERDVTAFLSSLDSQGLILRS